MVDVFGLAPLSLELDLDSYEGSWTHVWRFRQQNGWLRCARATLESENDIFRTIIVAACDEFENPYPAFQSAQLLECTWSNLGECDEREPELLDDLLCEQEGQVYARWQRETNVEIQQHMIATDDRIAALEARTKSETNSIIRKISDLRRRRRIAALTDDARSIFDKLIADLDAQSDAAFEAGRAAVSALRSDAAIREEALWQREDVIIEIEPMFLVRWRAIGMLRPPHPLAPDYGYGGASLNRVHTNDLRLLEAQRAAEAAERRLRREELEREAEEQREQTAPLFAKSENPLADRDDGKKLPDACRVGLLATSAAGKSRDQRELQPAARIVGRGSEVRGKPENGKAAVEHKYLLELLAALDAKGRKFYSGSPKFRRYQEARSDLLSRIAALNGDHNFPVIEPSTAKGNSAVPATPLVVPSAWTNDRMEELRRLWVEGFTASQIARQLGNVSRNAVIGKAKRLGLPMRTPDELSARQANQKRLSTAP